MPSNMLLTTPLIWTCTNILVGLDLILVLLAWRLVGKDQFRHMRMLLAAAGGVFYLGVWTSVLVWGWDWFYSYIFPAWGRYALPFIFGIGYTLLAWGMGWLCLKLPGNPAITWCVLGGLEGLLSHIFAIYGLGAATKPPIMQGTDPFAVLIFAVFEKAFYWSIILLVCSLTWRFARSQSLHAYLVNPHPTK